MQRQGLKTRAAFIGLAMTLVWSPALSQTSDENHCMSPDPVVKIKGCTTVIDSKTESSAGLAVAYSNRGNAYARRGTYELALADLTKAIALAPNDPENYNSRAWAYHLKGDDAKGLPDVQKAIAMRPGNGDTIETRAEIYEKLGQRDKAVADYRATLKLSTSGSQAVRDAQAGLKRLREVE